MSVNPQGERQHGAQAGDLDRGMLPTLQVEAEVDPHQALELFSQLPQAWAVSTLYAVHHRGHGPGDSLVRLIDNFECGQKWDDNTIDRIVVQQTPENLEEEEFMRLTNLKGSLTWLSWIALGISSIPAELKAGFTPPSYSDEDFSGHNYDDAVASLNGWARGNPDEANKPFSEPGELEKPLTKVCERLRELAEFYNAGQPIIAVYKIVFPEGYVQGKLSPLDELIQLSGYDRDMRRYSIIASLLDLFGADDQLKQLMVGMGAQAE